MGMYACVFCTMVSPPCAVMLILATHQQQQQQQQRQQKQLDLIHRRARHKTPHTRNHRTNASEAEPNQPNKFSNSRRVCSSIALRQPTLPTCSIPNAHRNDALTFAHSSMAKQRIANMSCSTWRCVCVCVSVCCTHRASQPASKYAGGSTIGCAPFRAATP